MFAVREDHGGALGPAQGPMIRERAIALAVEITGRDRDRVEPFVTALRRGEHVILTVAPEVSGLAGPFSPVRVDWIGPDTFSEPPTLARPRGIGSVLMERAS